MLELRWGEWSSTARPAFKATRYVCSEPIRSRCIIGRPQTPHPCRGGGGAARLLDQSPVSLVCFGPWPLAKTLVPLLKFGCARAFYASLRDSAIRLALSSFDFFTKKGYIAAGSPYSFNWRGDITRIRRDCKQYRQCIVFLLPLFFSTRRAQQEQGEMASKQVNKSLAEKPHGYEFLGPYVYLQNTSISTPQLTPPQPWRLCHLFRSARPGLCLHILVQRHLGMPCAHLAFSFRLQL